MLDYLQGKAGERKLRLFASAWCRQYFDVLWWDSQAAVHMAEKFAEGEATIARLQGAWDRVRRYPSDRYGGVAARVAVAAVCPNLGAALSGVISELATDSSACRLLRDVFGNPFRQTRVISSWLSWNDWTVMNIAEGIYEERAFGRMPILHDALLDAGCDDENILAHCRGEGPHVRGCWVVDLTLGKE
jgi:hypothetical protein